MSSDYPRQPDRTSTPVYKTVEGLRALPSQLNLRDPHLKRLMLEGHSVVAEGDQLMNGLSPNQLTWKPSPAVWSLAQIADHLYRSSDPYFPRLRAAIANGRATNRVAQPGEYQPGWFGKWFIGTMAPGARKVRTFKIFEPTTGGDPAAWPRFKAQQEMLYQILKDADGLNLRKNHIHSPVTWLVYLSLGEAFDVIITHQKRHLMQARQLRESPGFPAS